MGFENHSGCLLYDERRGQVKQNDSSNVSNCRKTVLGNRTRNTFIASTKTATLLETSDTYLCFWSISAARLFAAASASTETPRPPPLVFPTIFLRRSVPPASRFPAAPPFCCLPSSPEAAPAPDAAAAFRTAAAAPRRVVGAGRRLLSGGVLSVGACWTEGAWKKGHALPLVHSPLA